MAAHSLALFAVPIVLSSALSGQAPDAAALVAKVDRLRQPWPAFSAELSFQEKGHDTRWRLSVASNGDSRLDGVSPKQAVGRAVLMKGEQMWLLTPGSKRAIPVTPQQRLIGSAAGGDLARLKLAVDFQAAGIQEGVLDGQPCWRVDLAAKRSSVPYPRAELWVLKAGEVPRSVDFFFGSGKLAQSIRFDPPTQALGRPLIAGMQLGDGAHSGRMAMKLSGWRPGEPDAALFEVPK
jgi:hypothetical protein